jgi:hypothetical protein
LTAWGSNAAIDPPGDAAADGDAVEPGVWVAVDGAGRGVTIDGRLLDEAQPANTRANATTAIRGSVPRAPPAATGIRGC